MRIEKIRFRAGSSPGQPPLEIEPGQVVILVGPNNSGKSEGLKDIYGNLRGGRTGKVVQGIDIAYPDADEIWRMLQDIGGKETDPGKTYHVPESMLGDHSPAGTHVVQRSDLQVFCDDAAQGDDGRLKANFVTLLAVHLNAVTRLKMTENLPLVDQDHSAGHILDVLLREKQLYTTVEYVIEQAFPGFHFVIDQQKSQFRVRLSASAVAIETQRIRHPDVAEQLDKIPLLSEFGDGIRAFVGLTAGIVALGHKFILVDDPEAFLHPPVARVLGSELVRLARARNAQVFISTHSPFLVMGVLEASYEGGARSREGATLVRLTYDRTSGNATARHIEPNSLRTLMCDRLLRSTGVLVGLFHSGVVITESEEDKVFYDEINRRLVEAGRGHRDTLFLNAQNWQTTGDIAGPLREVGIPSALILDIDIISRDTAEWRAIPKACLLSPDLVRKIDAVSVVIRRVLDTESKPSDFKVKGVSYLTGQCQSDTRDVISELQKHGVFVVDRGELESWLPSLGITGKRDWTRRIFRALEAASVDPKNDNDVWNFIHEVGDWLSNPHQGMPL